MGETSEIPICEDENDEHLSYANQRLDAQDLDWIQDIEWGPDDEPEGFDSHPRTRTKSDLWHEFHNLPMKKSCPAKTSTYELLIHASFIFTEEDYDKVTKFLLEKGIAVDELDEHYYFNREWWRRRVRMVTYKADRHAKMIQFVHKFVREDETLKQYYDKDMETYFLQFEQKCRNGDFEELSDMYLFRHVGVDSHGLDLWIRLRGSVRAENMHQKMRVATGPWGVGARTGHWLLVNISYRYNVNAGVARLGHHDFGHPWLNYIDRIQIRMQEIFNAVVFPSHNNVLQFKPVKDWVAVGIGPLSYSTAYVDPGKPDPSLKGDLRFVAQQMRLKLPPMPIATPKEIKIYNDFRLQHPGMTPSDCRELARKYKLLSNGTTTFPKLPSMINQYSNQWKLNNEIKLLKKQIKTGFDTLVAKMSSDRVSIQRNEGTAINDEVEALVVDNRDVQQEQHLHVPPLCAPEQTTVVEIEEEAASAQQNRNCYYAPYCTKKAKVCGGWHKNRCSKVANGEVTVPAGFVEEKEERKRREKKEKARVNREAKKRKRDE